MPITAPIPLPGTGIDAFYQGMTNSQNILNSILENRLNPYKAKLMKAQANEAEMMSNFLQQLAGGNPNPAAASAVTNAVTNAINPNPIRPSQKIWGSTLQNQTTGQNVTPTLQNVGTAVKDELGPQQDTLNSSNDSIYGNDHALGGGVRDKSSPLSGSNDYISNSANLVNEESAIPHKGTQQPYTPENAPLGEEVILQTGDPSKYNLDRFAGTHIGNVSVPGLQKFTGDGGEYTKYPSGRVTFMKTGPTEQQKSLTQAKGKGTETTLTNLSKKADVSEDIGQNISGMEDLLKNPDYQSLAGSLKATVLNAKPFGLPVGAAIAPAISTPAQQEALGQANTYMGNMQQKFGQLFKGPYKANINTIVTTMKPNVNDPLFMQIAKVKALKTLNDIGIERNKLIADYVGKGMDTTAATLKADKQIPFSEVKKRVDEDFKMALKPGAPGGSAIPENAHQVGKEHVNEENIQYTMQQTGLSREEVIKKLKEKGLM